MKWLARSVLFGILAGGAPAALRGQAIHGRVVDAARRPLIGALLELRDSTGHSAGIVLTSPSGVFVLTAPRPGNYQFRVAAIGFQPHPFAPVHVPAEGVTLPDLVLQTMSMRLPDLVAVGRGKFCGKSGISDDVFSRILESAHTALQIIEATINQRAVGFQVARIHTRTIFGTYNNYEIADTALVPMAVWPVQSINPDTLRVVGFGRLLEPGNENSREYYGPDARVLFSDWFLDGHCFTVDKPKKHRPADTLHVRFKPAHKTRLIDAAGDLVLDAHNLALLEFSFTLTNLPRWMPDEAAGGEMQFSRLSSGLWVTKSWAIWAPIGGIAANRGISVAGEVETYGWVARVYAGNDTIQVMP
ncbi:MAG TPA: carboxypeptidase-like regulatory domain-containing protein [Gemmatimonadales bacterium]